MIGRRSRRDQSSKEELNSFVALSSPGSAQWQWVLQPVGGRLRAGRERAAPSAPDGTGRDIERALPFPSTTAPS